MSMPKEIRKNLMEINAKAVDSNSVKCPVCGSKIDYRNYIKKESVILKRYKAIIQDLKLEYGEIFVDEKTCLIGKIKELEHVYSILIKK